MAMYTLCFVRQAYCFNIGQIEYMSISDYTRSRVALPGRQQGFNSVPETENLSKY